MPSFAIHASAVDRMTDACENINLSATTIADGKKLEILFAWTSTKGKKNPTFEYKFNIESLASLGRLGMIATCLVSAVKEYETVLDV